MIIWCHRKSGASRTRQDWSDEPEHLGEVSHRRYHADTGRNQALILSFVNKKNRGIRGEEKKSAPDDQYSGCPGRCRAREQACLPHPSTVTFLHNQCVRGGCPAMFAG